MNNWIKIFIITVFTLASNSIFSFDHSHSTFDSVLKKYVKNGDVAYSLLKKDRSTLDQYLSSLSKITKAEYNSFSKEQKLAFLINSYNAFTIQLVINNYPISSIKNVKKDFLVFTPWKHKFFILLEEKRHLDWIEHDKLRIDFEEPRIHFAIVCASKGCPILISEAYTPEKLDSQLKNSMESFLKVESKNRYDASKGILYISPIFQWFEKDFTKKVSLLEFIGFGMNKTIPKNTKVEYTPYDWSLNDLK